MKSKFTSLREAKLSKDQQKQIIGGKATAESVICEFISSTTGSKIDRLYDNWAEANAACASGFLDYYCLSCEQNTFF